MESLQKIKSRIESVKNINQITKAMELVAATKMRKSQEIALASRPYAYTALDFLANLSKAEYVRMPELMRRRKVEKTAFVLVSSDKGLAGAFNSSVFRAFEKYVRENNINITDQKFSFIAVGQKSSNFLNRKKANVVESFVKFGDFTKIEEIKPMAEFLVKGYLGKEWDRVLVFSTNFRSALKQDVVSRQVLPVDAENLKESIQELVPETGKFSEFRRDPLAALREEKIEGWMHDYLIEPSAKKVLQELASHLVEMQVYHLILEANASEHAARRMAMKNASDNAEELGEKLTLIYNKSRQAVITRELVEITAGAEIANK